MKISRLIEKRLIHRPTRFFDESGKRIYNQFEYDFSYNPVHKDSERERVFAKIIDMLPFLLVFYFIFHLPFFGSFLISIPCVIISGLFCEWYFGTTLGKKVFGLTVLDDSGNDPGFIKSLQRNMLCLINLLLFLIDYHPPINDTWKKESSQTNFSMNFNNKFCKTYVIKEDKIKAVKERLHQGSLSTKST
ncbi:RDD family protein [Chryseobacterium sp. Mn2064]|uniref:RDD family protein n=1 Tax=Chryseobacterium sp. Mn2064 TaxID=3395263 RepID=UPI003BD236A5